MFKVTGKQKWGFVYRGGKCIVNFRNGVGYTDNADDAEYLKKRGYMVEGKAPAADPDPPGRYDQQGTDRLCPGSRD